MVLFGQTIPRWAAELILHNWPVMLYLLGTLIAAAKAYVRPSRSSVLQLYGFALLVLAFEYEKHGLSPVREVIDSLFEGNVAAREIAKEAVLSILPLMMYLCGLLFLVLSTAMTRRKVVTSAERDSSPA